VSVVGRINNYVIVRYVWHRKFFAFEIHYGCSSSSVPLKTWCISCVSSSLRIKEIVSI